MAVGKLRVPYRLRILNYCERCGVVVPSNFDATKSSDRFAVIDVTTEPFVLVSRTTCMEKEVIRYLESAGCTHRLFKILDFKRGAELSYHGEGKLTMVGVFDCKAPGEVLSLVE